MNGLALDGIVVMSPEDHADYVRSGCDPHCHACGRKLEIGDRYTLKQFVPAGELTTGAISGTACEACFVEGRGLSPEERVSLEARLQGRREAVNRLREAPQPGFFAAFDTDEWIVF